jgi:hypothetical protein
MIINALPEWRIITQSALIPVVAGWGIVNATILFIVCMMSLQVPVRRAEERFTIDEPISFRDASGTSWPGRSKDMSLSGICIELEGDGERAVQTSGNICVFIAEVGCVAATVVRERGRVLGLRFAPLPPVQRELLTRKLFTSGRDTTAVTTSAWQATLAMLGSIAWTRSSLPKPGLEPVAETAARPSPEKLPPLSLVIPPRSHCARAADLPRPGVLLGELDHRGLPTGRSR